MESVDSVREQNGDATVSSVALVDEGAVLEVEFGRDGSSGVRVVKQIGIEYDHPEYGAQAFELFRLATELAYEINSDSKIMRGR